MRARLLTMGAALVVLGAAASPVAAAKPAHFRESIDETHPATFCGINLTLREQVDVNVLINDQGVVKDLSTVRLTLSNASGDWMTNHIAGPVLITESLAGDILTTVADNRGLHSQWVASDGTRFSDRGRITFRTVIDLNTEPDPTPSDNVVVSQETLLVAGPHPEADSDFALFCETVTRVLD